MIKPYGWNTWDYKSYNTFAFLSGGKFELAIRIGIFDEKSLTHRTDFRWKDLVEAGPHAVDGIYISYRFKDEDAVFEVEAASDGDQLNCRIAPIGDTAKRIVVEILPAGGNCIKKMSSELKVDKWKIHSAGMHFKDSFFIRCESDYLISDAGRECVF